MNFDKPIYKNWNWKVYALLAVVIPVILFLWFISPPFSFPSRSVVTVQDGAGLQALTVKLKEDGVIRSPFWFRIAAIVLGGERDMKAGQYYLPRPQSVFTIAWRVFHGNYGVESVRITVPEGFTAEKIAVLFDERFQFFDRSEFLAKADEGYLFPDTYFVPVTADASSVLRMFETNFDRRLRALKEEIKASGKSFEEVIIMASIIEGEARKTEDMEIVSSILWKRIGIGMPLQVDATFVYLLGKGTKDLTTDDLKVDSPFNTYVNRGLPPSPISNPGLASIRAALYPVETEYLYFLTADDGTMHYSRTHDEHVAKKARYINRS